MVRERLHLPIILMTLAALLIGGCAPAVPTVAPTKPVAAVAPSPAVTAAPAPAVSTAAPGAPKAAPAVTPTPRPGEPSAAAKIKRGGILRHSGSIGTPMTFDPHLKTANDASLNLMFERFVRVSFNQQTSKIELSPGLAASWEFPNSNTVLLKLQKSVKFHDGSAFDAAVAKWNLDRMRTHSKSTARTWVEPIGSVDVVDDTTLRLNLKAPTGTILIMLTAPGSENTTGIVSKEAVEQMGEEKFGSNPVGSGPMKFSSWQRDFATTVSRFDGYWRQGADGKPLPYLDGLSTRFIPDQTVALVELRAGNVDITEIEAKDVPTVKTNPQLVYWQFDWVAFQRGIGFNTKEGKFTDARLREAVCRGIDRDAMAKVLAPGVGFAADYFWSPAQVGYSDSILKLSYDLDKAKQLLAGAGYPNGLEVTLSMVARSIDLRAAEMLQSMWAKVGINLTIDSMEREAWLSKVMRGGIFDMTMFRQTLMVDPDKYMGNFDTGGATNWTNLSDPELDQAMQEGRSSFDNKVRQTAYEQAQRIINERAYRCTTYLTPYNVTYQRYVKGVSVEWSGPEMDEAWLDK